MIQVRKANERGTADHGWLKANHTFSFGEYYDPEHVGFRTLRVMNEDRIAPGKGFGTHPHNDMEILTYIISGALEHKDSMGNGSVIQAGEVQRMSAGSGVTHSEFNPSSSESTHLYQIWLFPEKKGIEPGYEQKRFTDADKRGKLCLIASQNGEGGSLKIHQDAKVFAALIEDSRELSYSLAPDRSVWVQVVSGQVTLNGHSLESSDGAAVSNEPQLTLSGRGEILLFDLS